MALAAEQEIEHIGESRGMADHDHDLVHELSKRLDAIWRYDQFIANADDNEQLKAFWRELKKQDQDAVKQLGTLMREEINKGCFC